MRQARLSSLIAVLAVFTFAPINSAAGATDGSPSWVSRGNGAISNPNDMYRALLAVGVARPGAGVNVRTLRSKALENAKQEVARALQALAATVAKNGSDGSGLVAPGLRDIKATVAHDLARPLDTYVGSDGAHYALVALTGDQLLALTGITAVTFNPVFDKAALALPDADTVVGEGAHDEGSVTQDVSKIRQWGPEPVWIKGSTSPTLPSSAYMCGRGVGSSPEGAVAAGTDVLTNLLRTQAHAAAADLHAALGPMGLRDVHDADADASTNDALKLIEPQIRGHLVWADDKGRWYAVTCLERMGAAFFLAEQLKKYDTDIAAALAAASTAGHGTDANKDNLSKALKALETRHAGAALPRAFNLESLGLSSPYSLSDVAEAANPTPKNPALAVDPNGAYSLGFANAVVADLADQGVTPSLAALTPTPDLKLSAKISFTGPETGRENTGSAALLLVDSRSGKELYKGTVTAKGSSTTNIYDAERAAIKDLAKQTVGIVKKTLGVGAEPAPAS